jgi:methyltransferase
LKTYLVGQIAKSCGLFKVNEIIVYSNDRTHRMKNMSSEITTTEFFVRNLEYIETPQYLRKALFPRSDALKYSGLVNPLEGDHHLKITEWCRYREGVIVRRPVRENKGSWANIGLYKDCQVNMMLEENTRVTVRLNEGGFS